MSENRIRCPRCQCDAIYRYGISVTGKQRYRCQKCLYQFVEDPSKKPKLEKPTCPQCGAVMHVHHRVNGRETFRCSQYPSCRGYVSRGEKTKK